MRFCLLLLCLTAIGCGPVGASTAISDGQTLLIEAERGGAEKYARYEYFKAIAFLEEAKLKNGYGSYQTARVYAERAGELAKEARGTANRRRDLELRRLRGKQLLEKTRELRKRKPTKRPKAKPGDGTKTKPAKPAPEIKRRRILPPNMRKKTPGNDGK